MKIRLQRWTTDSDSKDCIWTVLYWQMLMLAQSIWMRDVEFTFDDFAIRKKI